MYHSSYSKPILLVVIPLLTIGQAELVYSATDDPILEEFTAEHEPELSPAESQIELGLDKQPTRRNDDILSDLPDYQIEELNRLLDSI